MMTLTHEILLKAFAFRFVQILFINMSMRARQCSSITLTGFSPRSRSRIGQTSAVSATSVLQKAVDLLEDQAFVVSSSTCRSISNCDGSDLCAHDRFHVVSLDTRRGLWYDRPKNKMSGEIFSLASPESAGDDCVRIILILRSSSRSDHEGGLRGFEFVSVVQRVIFLKSPPELVNVDFFLKAQGECRRTRKSN